MLMATSIEIHSAVIGFHQSRMKLKEIALKVTLPLRTVASLIKK